MIDRDALVRLLAEDAIHPARTDEELASRILALEKPDREAVRRAVAPVLFNVTNYPGPAQVAMLGQDFSGLLEKVVDAVMRASPKMIDREQAVAAFQDAVDHADWSGRESALEAGVDAILALARTEHGAPFELVIPCKSEEEALSERVELHVAAEARSIIRRLR